MACCCCSADGVVLTHGARVVIGSVWMFQYLLNLASEEQRERESVSVCVCGHTCVRACVRACVLAGVPARARVPACVYKICCCTDFFFFFRCAVYLLVLHVCSDQGSVMYVFSYWNCM